MAGSVALVVMAVATVPAPVAAAPVTRTAPGTVAQAAPVIARANDQIATISPDLATVRVDSPAYRTAFASFTATQTALQQATATRVDAEQQLVSLHLTDDQLTAQMASDTVRKKKAAARLAEIRSAIQDLAVADYINGGGNLDDLEAAVDASRATELGKEHVLTDAVHANQRLDEATTTNRYDEALKSINLAVNLRGDIRGRISNVSAVHEQAATDESTLGVTLITQQLDVDQTRALASVVGADFTLVALDAYYKGAQAMSHEAPSCGIPWWALAGISKVEGRHGTYGGSVLLANGNTSRKIIGIPLDGTANTASIGDTDNGKYDGDPTVDRAVGPMQFIPSTWVRWARDGNGDGVADPNNIYDAALTAARYLCQAGPGLSNDTGLTRAFLSYNHSDPYAANVLGWAHTYSRLRWA